MHPDARVESPVSLSPDSQRSELNQLVDEADDVGYHDLSRNVEFLRHPLDNLVEGVRAIGQFPDPPCDLVETKQLLGLEMQKNNLTVDLLPGDAFRVLRYPFAPIRIFTDR